MEEIIFHIKSKTLIRKLVGVIMILLGFVLHLIPLVPGSWAIIIGLEILGIRLLVQDLLKKWVKDSKHAPGWIKKRLR